MPTAPDDRANLVPLMQAYDIKVHRELAAEQVTHPVDLYQPGSERLERLYQAMETAQRFSWPLQGYQVNL